MTRTNCSDGLGESAFFVEVQAAREGSFRVAAGKGRNRVTDGGTNVDAGRGDRLAAARVDRASANGDPGVICVLLTQGKERKAMEVYSEQR